MLSLSDYAFFTAGKEKSQNPKILTFLTLSFRLTEKIGIPDFYCKFSRYTVLIIVFPLSY